MSVLQNFVEIRRYRVRASEYIRRAEAATNPSERAGYLTIAQHYATLAEAGLRTDRARVAEQLEQLRVKREQRRAVTAERIARKLERR